MEGMGVGGTLPKREIRRDIKCPIGKSRTFFPFFSPSCEKVVFGATRVRTHVCAGEDENTEGHQRLAREVQETAYGCQLELEYYGQPGQESSTYDRSVRIIGKCVTHSIT